MEREKEKGHLEDHEPQHVYSLQKHCSLLRLVDLGPFTRG